jgi:hypothetical protein
MKLKHYLTELAMKKGTKIDVKKKRGFHYNAKIDLEDGTQWFFNAVNNMGEGDWDISFWAAELAGEQKVKDKHKVGLQLFAAVEKLTKDFLKWEKPEQFRFSATGVSRIKLYNTLAKRILKETPYKKGQSMRLLQGNNWSFIKK